MSDTAITVDDIRVAHKVAKFVVDNHSALSGEYAGVETREVWFRISVDLEPEGDVEDYVSNYVSEQDEQVEAVAGAIYESRFPNLGGWDLANPFDQKRFRDHARAALAVVK